MEACGKLILCGEHFVLHGAPAVALPLHSLKLRLERRDSVLHDPLLPQAWNRARSQAGLGPEPGFPFTIRSSIPRGVGLGSSAALAVALVREAAVEAGLVASDMDTARMATEVEGVFHGSSSGLDPTVIALARPLLWRGGGDVATIGWSLEGTVLLVARAPSEGTTAEAVARTLAFAGNRPDRFAELLGEARRLAMEIADSLGGDAPGRGPVIGRAMFRFHEMLSEMGVSSRALDDLVGSARAAGAMGAKLTGAGMGGCVVALAGSKDADSVEKELMAAGALEVFRS